MEDAHEPGARGEEGVAQAGAPGGERFGVGPAELLESPDGLHALFRVPARDARVELAPGGARGGAGAGVLPKGTLPAEAGPRVLTQLVGRRALGLGQVLLQERDELGEVGEAGRGSEAQPDRGGQGTVL